MSKTSGITNVERIMAMVVRAGSVGVGCNKRTLEGLVADGWLVAVTKTVPVDPRIVADPDASAHWGWLGGPPSEPRTVTVYEVTELGRSEWATSNRTAA